MSHDFRVGETVRYTIEGPVIGTGPSIVSIKLPNGPALILSGNDLDRVERVAPAEWPPEPGDLWRSKSELWFAVVNEVADDMPVVMVGMTEGGLTPDEMLRADSPLTLVHRNGQPAPAPASVDPEKLARLLCRTSYEVRGSAEAATTWDMVSDAIRAEYRQEADALLRLCIVTPRQQDGGAE